MFFISHNVNTQLQSLAFSNWHASMPAVAVPTLHKPAGIPRGSIKNLAAIANLVREAFDRKESLQVLAVIATKCWAYATSLSNQSDAMRACHACAATIPMLVCNAHINNVRLFRLSVEGKVIKLPSYLQQILYRESPLFRNLAVHEAEVRLDELSLNRFLQFLDIIENDFSALPCDISIDDCQQLLIDGFRFQFQTIQKLAPRLLAAILRRELIFETITRLSIDNILQVNNLALRLGLSQDPELKKELIAQFLAFTAQITDINELMSVTNLYGAQLTALTLRQIPDSASEIVDKILKNCPRLTTLSLYDCKIGDQFLFTITQALPNLREIQIHGCPNVTNRGIAYLAVLNKLSALMIECPQKLDGKCLEWLPRISTLTQLSLPHCCFDEKSLMYLSRIPDLKKLNLDGWENLSGEGFTFIAQLPRLIDLSIAECPVSNMRLMTLAQSQALQKLNLSDSRIAFTDEALRVLANQSTLTDLCLDFAKSITNNGLMALSRLPALQNLSLVGCHQISLERVRNVMELCDGELNISI